VVAFRHRDLNMIRVTPTRRATRDLVLSPQEPLVAGGAAEQLEQQIQASLKSGALHVVVDLRGVPMVDSAGIRAIIRGHTSAQRLGRRFTLVGPNARVRQEINVLRLQDVLQICETMAVARQTPLAWARLLMAAAVIVVGLGLVIGGLMFPGFGLEPMDPSIPVALGGGTVPPTTPPWSEPVYQFLKLVVAAIVGMLVTVVHRHYRADREPNPTMDQAQVLLCISGALMMIIIGSSVARAFGIAGAASIIRFRTPVDDAKDITVLFILMGLGMAAGVGGFALAGMGTLFLCGMLPLLNVFSTPKLRLMLVEVVAKGREFPFERVEHVFALNHVLFEPREVSQGDEASVEYLATLPPDASLEEISSQLLAEGQGKIENVSWSPPKRV
jgi:anti-anti-sigma factor